MRKLDKFAGELYLGAIVAEDYPEQEPAYKVAKWYDLLWLLIPLVGIIPFILSVEERYNKS